MKLPTPSRQVGVTADVAFKRAVWLQQRGDLDGAENIYRAILKQYPKHFQTLLNLGTVLLYAERMEESARFLRKALKQAPDSALAHSLLAWAHALLGRYEEALQGARRATALDPELPEAHATLAQRLADLGRYDEAIRAQARAIELAPDQPRLYNTWGHLTRWTADDPRFAALEALAQKSGSRPLDEQVELNFALGKAYTDCGDVDRAFRHQIIGGALQRRIFRYDEASTLRELGELCRVLNAAWIGRHREVGHPSPLPVFIVGMPRSGTTLVEQILASHPKVQGLGERMTFNDAIAELCGMPTVPLSLGPRAAQWPSSELRRLGGLYLEATRRGVRATTSRIIDKLPSNFQFAGLIHAALPNARIIHTCRDPVDTCLSMFSILFSGRAQLYSYDLGELGRYYRAYEKAMAHWRNVLPPGTILDVRYEEVVDDLERQARRIVAHCGLEWDDSCLEFYKTERPVRTVSHAQVRQPIYRSSISRARPDAALLRPLLEALEADGGHVV
jgi:tetratricopeptide (TPR) repeat protein